jgi:hypothetical protein
MGKNRRLREELMDDRIKVVEAIFWNDSDKERWGKAVELLKSLPRSKAEQVMAEARRRAEDQQSFYGVKDGYPQHEIENNARRIREIARLTMTWVRS